MESAGLGLRERKNARTREAIERAALELALEQGFAHTTVEQIAARADVAPRTVFGRYPTKEAIVFGSEAHGAEGFRSWLEGENGDLVQRLAGFLKDKVACASDRTDIERLRLRVMLTDPHLRQVLRGKLDEAERRIAARLSDELALPPHDTGVEVFAAAVSGLFLTMAERAVDHPHDFEPMSDCERGLAVLSAALDALTSGSRPSLAPPTRIRDPGSTLS